jgi:putative tricarboxylic transport membrane protein
MNPTPDNPKEGVSTHWPELIVAGVLLAVALLVIVDSLRTGIGWADDGPRSGYFPFCIGLFLAAASGAILIGQLRDRSMKVFAERAQLSMVVQVFIPIVLYVALIAVLGIYAASVLLIAYFMRRHGRYGWLLTAGVSVAVPLAFFGIFERWFLVPLIKGPLEAWLGL